MPYIAELIGNDHCLAAIAASSDAAVAAVRSLVGAEAPFESWSTLKVRSLESWTLPSPSRGLLSFKFRIDPGPEETTILCRTDVTPAMAGADFATTDVAWWTSVVAQLAPSGAFHLEELELQHA